MDFAVSRTAYGPLPMSQHLHEAGWDPSIVDQVTTWDDLHAAHVIAEGLGMFANMAAWTITHLGNTPACRDALVAIANASDTTTDALYRRFDRAEGSDRGGEFPGSATGKPVPTKDPTLFDTAELTTLVETL